MSQPTGERRGGARRPVYVTRKFPPSVGGMETLAASVWRSLSLVRPDAVKISHSGTNKALVRWVPACLARLAWLALRGEVAYVLCGDALMNAVCAPVLRVFGIPHPVMIHGLDVTYENRLYGAIIDRPLRSAPVVIANSAATAARARQRGAAAERVVVLRLGVERPAAGLGRAAARAAVRRRFSLADDDVVLLTLGRLVRRKGARWFTESVLPQLGEHIHYVVAGEGPDQEAIRAAAQAAGVSARVHLAGLVPNPSELREDLLAGADLFLQPNIHVPGNMEGFGLVMVEAAIRGTPVLASALDGIGDAVLDGRTGILAPPGDAAAWAAEITGLLGDPQALAALGKRFQAEAEELYSEETMGRTLCAHLPG